MKKRMVVFFIGTSLVSMLSGCSASEAKPQTAVDIVERQVKNKDMNFQMSGDMEFVIHMSAQGADVQVPIQLSLDVDVADEFAHGTVDMTVAMMDMFVVTESNRTKFEFYTDADESLMYSCTDEDNDWYVSDIDEETENTAFLFTKSEYFEDADMAYDEKENTYTIVMPMDVMLEDESYMALLEDSFNFDDMGLDVDSDEFFDALGDTDVTYVYDAADCRLLSVTMDDFSYETTTESDDVILDVAMTMNMEFAFSHYGIVDEDDVIVPKDVKKNAIETLDSESEDNLIQNVLQSESQEEDERAFVKSDVYGSYNGINFTTAHNDWARTFGKDGWSFDLSSDEDYSFVVATNEKYGEDISLYLYNFMSDDNVFAEEIETNGFSGYEIDATYAESYPDMTWNGITFGADGDAVVAAYGDADYVYECELYSAYTYSIFDDVELEFYVYPNEGLKRVSCIVWDE